MVPTRQGNDLRVVAETERTEDNTPPLAFERVDANHVEIDRSYYRSPREPRIADIVSKGFDPMICGVITLNRRASDDLYLIDGQTRLLAAVRAHILTLPALVWQGLSPEEENERYERQNTARASISPSEVFKSQLARGDKAAAAIDAIVRESGYRVSIYGDSYDENAIVATRSLYVVYGFGGDEVLRTILRVTREAWPDDGRATQGMILKALFMFVTKHKNEYGVDRLIAQMARIDIDLLKRRGRAKEYEIGGGSPVTNLYRAIVDEYNTKTKSSERLRYKGGSVSQVGEWNSRAKLSDSDIATIIEAWKSGSVSKEQLAEQYGVRRSTISGVIRGKRSTMNVIAEEE